jgi:hypothetical protein
MAVVVALRSVAVVHPQEELAESRRVLQTYQTGGERWLHLVTACARLFESWAFVFSRQRAYIRMRYANCNVSVSEFRLYVPDMMEDGMLFSTAAGSTSAMSKHERLLYVEKPVRPFAGCCKMVCTSALIVASIEPAANAVVNVASSDGSSVLEPASAYSVDEYVYTPSEVAGTLVAAPLTHAVLVLSVGAMKSLFVVVQLKSCRYMHGKLYPHFIIPPLASADWALSSASITSKSTRHPGA